MSEQDESVVYLFFSSHKLSGIWTHVPLITGRVWSPLHYQSNPAGYTANLDSEWEFYVVLPG